MLPSVTLQPIARELALGLAINWTTTNESPFEVAASRRRLVAMCVGVRSMCWPKVGIQPIMGASLSAVCMMRPTSRPSASAVGSPGQTRGNG
jgi:hypothetical protein